MYLAKYKKNDDPNDVLPIGHIAQVEDGTPIPEGWQEVDLADKVEWKTLTKVFEGEDIVVIFGDEHVGEMKEFTYGVRRDAPGYGYGPLSRGL